ncbi:hypothetical protein GCM10027036_06150 [Flavihumibacter cheonanensis]|jgi:hypothetical protein
MDMSRILLAIALLILSQSGIAQKKKSNSGKTTTPLVDSIAFHLYTDSLKKGVHNYINVDGLVAGKSWYPLSSEDIQFESDEGQFEGNSLVLPVDFSKEKVTITATYKRNPKLRKEITIYIKKLEEGPLKSKDEIMEEIRRGGKKKRGR